MGSKVFQNATLDKSGPICSIFSYSPCTASHFSPRPAFGSVKTTTVPLHTVTRAFRIAQSPGMQANTLVTAPASEAVRYQTVSYDGELDTVNPYRGEPRPELDKAWHDLLLNNNIRISKEELQKMNRTAIELYDGSGYFGQMNAYHHLHCLVCSSRSLPSIRQELIKGQKFLRQVLHSEYYDVNTPDRDTHVGALLLIPRKVHDARPNHC